MKLFIFENDEKKIEFFKNQKEHKVTICSTLGDAINECKEQYDYIFMNHNLDKFSLRREKQAGFIFVMHLIHINYKYKETPIILHSGNVKRNGELLNLLWYNGFIRVYPIHFESIKAVYEKKPIDDNIIQTI